MTYTRPDRAYPGFERLACPVCPSNPCSGQSPQADEMSRLAQISGLAADLGSWRPVGKRPALSGFPDSHPPHHFAAVRAERRAGTGRNVRGVGEVRRFVVGGRMPGFLLRRAEHGRAAEQGAHAVAAHFGRRMQPAEIARAGKIGRQDVLEEAAHPVERVEGDGDVPAGGAVAVGPADLASGQQGQGAIVRGGLEDVAREIAQGVFTGAGVLAADVPMTFPDFGGNLLEEVGMFLEQSFFEDIAEALAQGLVMEKELVAGAYPAASVGAQSAGGDEVMDVGMEEEGAAPGVEDAQHTQLGAEAFGVGGEVLQGSRAGGKEEVQSDLEMRADEHSQLLRDGEGGQKVGHGKEEPRALAFQPGIGVELAALGTVAVVAGMILVVKARTVRTLEEFAAQGRGAAGEGLSQDLPVPAGHGGAKTLPIIRSCPLDELMNREAFTTVAGGRAHHRLFMKSSRRF